MIKIIFIYTISSLTCQKNLIVKLSHSYTLSFILVDKLLTICNCQDYSLLIGCSHSQVKAKVASA